MPVELSPLPDPKRLPKGEGGVGGMGGDGDWEGVPRGRAVHMAGEHAERHGEQQADHEDELAGRQADSGCERRDERAEHLVGVGGEKGSGNPPPRRQGVSLPSGRRCGLSRRMDSQSQWQRGEPLQFLLSELSFQVAGYKLQYLY